MSNWEVVKGFCRRRTQEVKERLADIPHTVDEQLNTKMDDYVLFRTTAINVQHKMKELEHHLECVHRVLGELSAEFNKVAHSDEMQAHAKRLELFSADSRNKSQPLAQSTELLSQHLLKFVAEASQLETLRQDHRNKQLEYDFFRNKVVKLKANPPTDPARIPRNEQREAEWKEKYEEAKDRINHFIQSSRLGGDQAMLRALVACSQEYGRYCEEMGRSARALLIVEPSKFMSATVKNVVTEVVTSAPCRTRFTDPKAEVPVSGDDTPFASTQNSESLNASTRSRSVRFADGDDPFAV